MSKSKLHKSKPLQKGKFLILSLNLALGLSAATVQSLVWAPDGLATPGGNWYDNENTFFDRGKRDYNSGQFDQAVKDLTECIKLNSRRADVFYWRSLTYPALHQNDQAVLDLGEAIKLDPHSASAFLNRGLIYSNEGKHDLAIADFDRALALDGGLNEARQNRDFCQKELDRGKVAQQKTKEQTDQASVAASGGNVVSSSFGGGAAPSFASASVSAASVQSASGSTYTPYVGRGDAKLIALQKEQKGSRGKTLPRKAGADRMAAERARAEAKSRELAIKQDEAEARKEHERTRLAELEANKLAMAKAPATESALPLKASRAGHGTRGSGSAATVSASEKSTGATDALEIVNRPVRDKWALIVGISNFQNSKLNLHYPAKDAQDFYDFLTKEGNFAKDHVKLLVNEQATRANILSDLGDRWLPHVANPDDLVLIYISSHGSPADSDVRGVNYLLAYDSDPDTLFASGLPMQDLSNVIKTRVHSGSCRGGPRCLSQWCG